ncbi:MAG: RNA methyltransferase [Burkholderiales bacterium]|nr:RNA methyltransferase [Burkholderiales bacterium]
MSDPTRFVLVHTSHAGNVGAAARAMKVMGFSELVLVRPRLADVASRDEALAMASGASDVLAAARVVDTLEQALEGCTHACATAMTPRDFGPPTHAPRPYLQELARQVPRLALVFGPERTGLANADVYRCHACLSIPTDPAYGSLNLAQAVQLLAYEWRQALGGYPVLPRTAPAAAADLGAVQATLAHWEQALVKIGFLNPAAPKKLMPRLQQLLLRARLSPQEVDILRGVARAVDEASAPSPSPSRSPSPARRRGHESGGAKPPPR